MPRAQTKSHRVEARISPDMLAIVKRAAEIQGRSISDFIASSAQAAAVETIERVHVIKLSMADSLKVLDLLENPRPPTEAWKRAEEAHRRLIRTSE